MPGAGDAYRPARILGLMACSLLVPTHRRLPKTETIAVVAKNLADLVAGCGYRDVVELRWAEHVTVGDVTITAVPVKHWGTRNVWPDDRGWTGFVLEHRNGTVFFP